MIYKDDDFCVDGCKCCEENETDFFERDNRDRTAYNEETRRRLAWRAFEYMMFNDEENQ